jgi:hypothetical protein
MEDIFPAMKELGDTALETKFISLVSYVYYTCGKII